MLSAKSGSVKEVDLITPGGAYWSPDGKQIAVVLFNWELSLLLEPIDQGCNPFISSAGS